MTFLVGASGSPWLLLPAVGAIVWHAATEIRGRSFHGATLAAWRIVKPLEQDAIRASLGSIAVLLYALACLVLVRLDYGFALVLLPFLALDTGQHGWIHLRVETPVTWTHLRTAAVAFLLLCMWLPFAVFGATVQGAELRLSPLHFLPALGLPVRWAWLVWQREKAAA